MADEKKAKKYCWDDEEIEKLLDLYEEHPCLWDIRDPSYQKREVKERALAEIGETLEIESSVIKAKWNSLRAQYGRECAKENKNSGQSTDELYESKWMFKEKNVFCGTG